MVSSSQFWPLHTEWLIFVAVCDCPLKEETNDYDTSSVRVIGYSNPALEGTSIMFHCPSGLTLIGPMSTTCMENGEWEPDPVEVKCTGKSMIKNIHTSLSILHTPISTQQTQFTQQLW